MKMKTLVIDDDKPARNILCAMLQKYCHNVTVCGEAANYKEALVLIDEVSPDIVFLDIDLGIGTGFDLLASVEKRTFHTICVTAYSSYAIKAIKWSAQDYLLKPVDPDELITAVNKVANNTPPNVNNNTARHDNLYRENIGLPSVEGLKFVHISDIVRCESKRSYTEFHFTNHKKTLVSKSIQMYEDILEPYGFLRVHKSHLVNTNCIKEYIKGRGGKIIMSDNAVISVASRKREEFLSNILC